MTSQQVLAELKSMGKDSIKKVLLNHGAREPFYGVPVESLKKIKKKIKTDYKLAIELYDTGISDAMYLAGLIADDAAMTRKDLQRWAKGAYWYMLSEFTVPWVASGNKLGLELALEWIESPAEHIAASGWSTYSCILSRTPNDAIDEMQVKKFLLRIKKEIHTAPNRVRYQMNNFIISVGGYFAPLSTMAIETGIEIGRVNVNVGNTACKVPFSPEYIGRMKERGSLLKKRSVVKC